MTALQGLTRLASAAAAVAVLVASFAFAPARTQAAEPGTIVDVAVGAGQFTTLVSLLQATGLDAALAGDGPFTVFAPNDEAFAKVPKPVLNELAKDPEALKKVLLFHVAAGKFEAAQVVGLKSVTTLEGSSATVRVAGPRVMIENAGVIATDVQASNGVIHVIDRVILPAPIGKTISELMAKPDLVTTAIEAKQFTTLVALVQQAGLADVLKNEGPFTVFAPTDEAFAAVPQEVLEALAADTDALKNVLLYHVVDGRVPAGKVVTLDKVKTLQGSEATITVSDEGVKIDNANVIKTDVTARNGIIHVIDAVILPPAKAE